MNSRTILLANHSQIVDYPIDFTLYPDAEDVKFIEIDLVENEYLFIPKLWFHWVFTEPETVAISFNVKHNSIGESKNITHFLHSNTPYKGSGKFNFNIKHDFSYEKFKNDLLYDNFRVLNSITDDCSPVIKTKFDNKFFEMKKLYDIIEYSKTRMCHCYIGQGDFTNSMPEFYDDIDNFIELGDIPFDYIPKLWLTIDKPVNSGLHYDQTDNILYVLTGKKKIFLTRQENRGKLYMADMQRPELKV